MRYHRRFTRLLAFALLSWILACSKSGTNPDEGNSPRADVVLESNPNVAVLSQNGQVNQILVTGKVKNTGESTAYNVRVKYTQGSLSASVTTSPSKIEPQAIATFAKLIAANSAPQSPADFKVEWDNTPSAAETHATSDLQGSWMGAFNFAYPDGRTRAENNIGMSFDAQGKVTGMTTPNLVSLNGHATVSSSGAVSGSFTMVNVIDVPNNIQDSTAVNVQGSMTTKNDITLTMNATYARSNGTGGTYSALGTLARQ